MFLVQKILESLIFFAFTGPFFLEHSDIDGNDRESKHVSQFLRICDMIVKLVRFYRNMENLMKVSELYDTDQSFIQIIRNISEQLPLKPLPDVAPGSTCVVVGSSGILLRFPELGNVIDTYDHVIRINFAPTSTFKSFVGSNTSLHFAYSSSLSKALKNKRGVENSHILFGGQ